MARNQRTIKSPVEIEGVGLHSGEVARVKLKPAPPGHGIVFTRVDLPDAPSIPAAVEYVAPATRRTTLRNGRAEVDTVEHLLAACHGAGVDNLEVEIHGVEMPSADGSARPMIEALRKAGISEQKAQRKVFVVEEPIYVREKDATLVALPSDEGFSVQYHAVFGQGNGKVASQVFSYDSRSQVFADDIAPARTFCLKQEVEALREAGLGKGASLENTVVIGEEGQELRFADEPVRHKILDLVGDLMLLGADIQGHLIATRTGHSANAKLVKRMREDLDLLEERGDLPIESGLGIQEILQLLPHRYPFLLVDRVVELEGFRRAVGIKNVTFNEPFFTGHFPDQPLFPGVLQLEAMAQLAGVLLLRKLENTGKLAVLWSIDKVKLRGAVVPGDQLRIEVQALRVKPSLGQVLGRCKVRGRLVSEATLMFTLVDA